MNERVRPEANGVRRRSVLGLMGWSVAAAAAPAVVPDEAQAMRATPDQRAARYRETDHVRTYYQTNRR
ncbi:formate dehydrogenase [Alsobacter sp. R-9]